MIILYTGAYLSLAHAGQRNLYFILGTPTIMTLDSIGFLEDKNIGWPEILHRY